MSRTCRLTTPVQGRRGDMTHDRLKPRQAEAPCSQERRLQRQAWARVGLDSPGAWGSPSDRGCRGRDVTRHLVARCTPTTSRWGAAPAAVCDVASAVYD